MIHSQMEAAKNAGCVFACILSKRDVFLSPFNAVFQLQTHTHAVTSSNPATTALTSVEAKKNRNEILSHYKYLVFFLSFLLHRKQSGAFPHQLRCSALFLNEVSPPEMLLHQGPYYSFFSISLSREYRRESNSR
ncbi:hypothetical protein CEXT_798031 [Caerostris extrusa]|uniref:Uncharacterized protein n=1 Tax=Caerostris extrusa TaxID=172846 RepID=A0AAV4V6J9_CAEEX|nr:hypothetical protein CEXT_798031 [Caerostris extrusa]